MNKILFTLLITSMLLLLANSPPSSNTPNKLEGYWMAGAVNIAPNYYRPVYINYWYGKNGEGQKRYLDREKIIDFTYEFGIGDSVNIDERGNTKCVFVKPNVLKEGRFPFYYQKVISSKNEPTTTDVQQYLLNTFWVNKREALLFDKDGKVKYYSHKKGYQTYCYNTFEDAGMCFLQKKGNASFCEGQIHFLEKINHIGANELQVMRWEGDGFQEITYKASTTLPNAFKAEKSDFQLSNPYLNQHLYHDTFYHNFSFYKGGLYAINKIFKQDYLIPNNTKGETGRIRLLFAVNYEGKTGHFTHTGLDEN
ncbi:MAG: hypothetical protein ACPG49_02240, partial [Chitinophagales bacterium]